MINMVITTAGRQALINSESTGTNAVTIAQIGVGTGRYTPNVSQTTLQNEIKRLNIIEGGSAGDNAFHVAYQDESTDAYSVYEFGLFLDNGILFAVYSTSDLVLQKTINGIALLAVDISLEDISVSQINFGSVTFSNAAATTTNAGVIALATAAEVIAGEATQKTVTPANLKLLTSTDARRGLVELATSAEATTGADTERAITPATAKAIVDARIATNAEVISGTNPYKFVSPSGLAGLTATDARRGLVELATSAEAISGVDASRAITPATLRSVVDARVKTASTTQAGIIAIATTAEAGVGTDNAKAVTALGVQTAIAQYDGNINNGKVIAEGASTARTLANRFADGITPKDFGAVGNGVANDTAAFTSFETRVTGRDVDLEGLTYLVTARPSANNYYNGNFKVGNVTTKPIYDFYKFGGTAERSINVKREFSEFQRGGAALLAGDYIRSGTAAGAVVQSCVWDDVNRYMYSLHTTSGDLGVINRFSGMKFGGAVKNESTAYTTASTFIGHQGLGVEYRSGGTIKLWASMTYEAAGASVTSKGTKAVRFNPPTANNQNIDSSIEIFNLFPEVAESNQATTVCTSYSGKYLIAKYSVSGTNDYRVRIFKLEDLTTAGDYSNRYIHEFTITLTRDVTGGVAKALQGMACDDRYIYFLAASYGYAEKHSIYVSDMFGNVVDEYRDLSVGKEIGRDAGTTYYEPESLFFMSLNGSPKLIMQIATGDTVGSRLCQLIALNTRQSYFFPTGTGTGSYHGVAIDESARLVNTEGRDNISLYPSGLSQFTQARVGANQHALARFSNDVNGSNFVFLKSRGTSVGTSASAVAGDTIGSLHFLIDNGNIDYSGTVQGARAGGIYGKVFESSTLTSAGTTNIGVRGCVVIEACSDENSRSGKGIEIIDNVLRPTHDNNSNLGTAGRRWKEVFSVNGVINTSDARRKDDIKDIDDAVLNAWAKVNFRQYRLKGETKISFGVIAQEIIKVFAENNLNALDYGVVTGSDEEGYGVRYHEALILEVAYQRKLLEEILNERK